MTSAQLARVHEYQDDFCELTDTDFNNPNFWAWQEAYYKYVRYGPDDTEKGGQNPGHKPPL